MDFNWALEQMKKGMKVGRVDCVSYIQLKDGKIVNAENNSVPMLLELLQSNDWYLSKEPKKTLSDKVFVIEFKTVYEENDIRISIDSIMHDLLKDEYVNDSSVIIKNRICEIFIKHLGGRFRCQP